MNTEIKIMIMFFFIVGWVAVVIGLWSIAIPAEVIASIILYKHDK